MFKRKILLITLLFCLFNLNAQEQSNMRLRIEPGLHVMSNSQNLGLFLNVEPKIKISENTVIGLRFGLSLNSQKFKNNDDPQFIIDDKSDNAVISFVPTFDYYLNEEDARPYLGLGFGYYLVSPVAIANHTKDVSEGSVNNQVGFLFRGGFDLGNTRFGMEYNIIPKADIEIPNGELIGTVYSSYFGLTVGFTIGGRKS